LCEYLHVSLPDIGCGVTFHRKNSTKKHPDIHPSKPSIFTTLSDKAKTVAQAHLTFSSLWSQTVDHGFTSEQIKSEPHLQAMLANPELMSGCYVDGAKAGIICP
jgi:hypothetical protein